MPTAKGARHIYVSPTQAPLFKDFKNAADIIDALENGGGGKYKELLGELYGVFVNHVKKWKKDITSEERDLLKKLEVELK